MFLDDPMPVEMRQQLGTIKSFSSELPKSEGDRCASCRHGVKELVVFGLLKKASGNGLMCNLTTLPIPRPKESACQRYSRAS